MPPAPVGTRRSLQSTRPSLTASAVAQPVNPLAPVGMLPPIYASFPQPGVHQTPMPGPATPPPMSTGDPRAVPYGQPPPQFAQQQPYEAGEFLAIPMSPRGAPQTPPAPTQQPASAASRAVSPR